MKKTLKIQWFYGQWQDSYNDMKKLGVQFTEGLPNFDKNLSDIKSSDNNIIVMDDLMTLAQDSMTVSNLFTQGRHHNVSVIMMLQNAFPKGKYNSDISRNASHTILFRSNADRRQINFISNRIFCDYSSKFMEIYTKETCKPQSYVVIENTDETISEKQIVLDLLGVCKYVNIYGTKSQSQQTNTNPIEIPTRSTELPTIVSPTAIPKPRKHKRRHEKVEVITVKQYNEYLKKWSTYYSRSHDIIKIYIGEHLTKDNFRELGREFTPVPVSLESGHCLIDYQRDKEIQRIVIAYFDPL